MPFPILLAAPPKEARFDVILKGRQAGVATYRLSDRPGGGRVTRLRIVLADRSTTETLALSDSGGAMVRTEDVVRRGNSYHKETVAYDARGDATVVDDKGSPVVVTFDRRGSRRDPSETWFRGVVPAPGTWAVFRKLNSRKRTWELVRVTYVGRQGGGNLVRQQAGTSMTSFTLDDAGMLLSYAAGDLRLVRR